MLLPHSYSITFTVRLQVFLSESHRNYTQNDLYGYFSPVAEAVRRRACREGEKRVPLQLSIIFLQRAVSGKKVLKSSDFRTFFAYYFAPVEAGLPRLNYLQAV